MKPRSMSRPVALISLFALFAAACGDGGGDDNSPTPTAAVPTATRTAVFATVTPTQPPAPTTTPTSAAVAQVSGLVVARGNLATDSSEALPAPPDQWNDQTLDAGALKALANADWIVDGPAGLAGTTAHDGTFAIDSLPAGEYEIRFSKTLNGNLIQFGAKLVVGDDGAARILVEVDQGIVRTTVDYERDGAAVRDIAGPDGSHATFRDGKMIEVSDPSRGFVDPDGDGGFVPKQCVSTLSRCDDGGDCDDGLLCQCTASCPACEDCGQHVCAPRGLPTPYRCDDGGTCRQPGDRCICVSSCPECDDCVTSVCVPSCEPVTVTTISLRGPAQLALGRSSSFRALAQLADGNVMDVTYQVEWSSSDSAVASIDPWGTVSALAIGTTQVRATLGDIASEPAALAVVERPAITQLQIQVAPCFYPFGRPTEGGAIDDAVPSDAIPHPYCTDVVRVGRSVSLVAWAYFGDGQVEDVTRAVEWRVTPSSVGSVADGLFTGTTDGTASIEARFAGVESNELALRVVSRATIVQLSIYANQAATPPILFPVFADDPTVPGSSPPCFDCGAQLSVLLGDPVSFIATARYDTGEWEDVTERATWRSSDAAVAPISSTGKVQTLTAGSARIDATYEDAVSNPVDLRVVEQATLVDLSIYQEGNDRTVEKLGNSYFAATASYDVGFARAVTPDAQWHSSDETIGGFDQPGVFTGRSGGEVVVWAVLAGKRSNELRLSVFERSDLTYCDPERINRVEWSDAFNRVVLESDCATYTPPDTAEVRFTVTERERPIGVFDPCLDLYVYKGGNKVRTIREQGCGEPFLPAGAPGAEDALVRFQHKAFWDLKDDRGNVVAPGAYRIIGRFYLYYDPVVDLPVSVVAPNGRIPCQQNDCANGCGYVHRCGDTTPPSVCPAVCTSLCECPSGWGLTDDGDCEPCGAECCPPGASCDHLPPCAVECCPPNARCLPDVPPCTTDQCCPVGALCGPLNLPPCELKCCPAGALCLPEIPACDALKCCAPFEVCPDLLPACR